MEVRKATIKDLKKIQELNKALFDEEFDLYDDTLNVDWPLGKSGGEVFRKLLTSKDNCVFVAEVETEVVGYLAGGEIDEGDFRTVRRIGQLKNMFVLSEYRGKGSGRGLYDAFAQWCKGRGVKRVKVEASAGNDVAALFYEGVGLGKFGIVLEGDL